MSKTVKYKLVDKGGFLANHVTNSSIYKLNNSEVFEGVPVTCGGIDTLCGYIREGELNTYFQKIEDEAKEATTPNYWDGKSELEVGMVVDTEYTSQSVIRCIEKEEVVLYVGGVGLRMETLDDIIQCKDQEPKSKTFKKFLSEWQGHDMMTYAFDTKDSVASIGEVFDFTYDFLINEGLLNE